MFAILIPFINACNSYINVHGGDILTYTITPDGTHSHRLTLVDTTLTPRSVTLSPMGAARPYIRAA